MAVICKNHENHGKISASIHTPKRDVFINTCIYSSAVLHQKLDLDEITAVLRTRHLRWYGHYSVPLRALTPSRVWGFQAPEIVGGQGRLGPHVSEMI